MTDNYIPYGEEWEKEMMKLPKKFLIDMIRKNKEAAKQKSIALLEWVNKHAIEVGDKQNQWDYFDHDVKNNQYNLNPEQLFDLFNTNKEV